MPKKKKQTSEAEAKEKKSMIGPRLRLTPKLTPYQDLLLPSKTKESTHQEKPAQPAIKVKVEVSEGNDDKNSQEVLKAKPSEQGVLSEIQSTNRNIHQGASLPSSASLTNNDPNDSEYTTMDEDSEEENEKLVLSKNSGSKGKDYKKAYKKRRIVRNSIYWHDKELMALAEGLQNFGFADLKKVAKVVKTKTENDIFQYIRRRVSEVRTLKYPPATHRGRPANRFTTASLDIIETWPNARKWRKFAYNQTFPLIRKQESSKALMVALCKKFFEEEEDPADPQVLNVKLIYKYMMDCMSGQIPPQLPPKESAAVLDLMREVRSIIFTSDFEEEIQFLKNFEKPIKFRPFEVKDEFKKQVKKRHQDMCQDTSSVAIPQEIFMDMSRHKRILQGFNPLVIPGWLIQKEQEQLEKYFEANFEES